MITDVRGEHLRPLLESPPTDLEGLFWENPAWSRDGSEIAMVGYDSDPNQTAPGRSVLAVVEVATGEVTRVGELAKGRLHSFPRWSPDGQAIVLNVDHFTGDAYDGATVAVIHYRGDTWSAPEEITKVGQYGRVDWHPTEDLIVFGDYDIGGFETTDEPTNLYTIRSDGSERTPVTSFGSGAELATQPTWTSDGRIIFTYVTGNDDEVREQALAPPLFAFVRPTFEPEVLTSELPADTPNPFDDLDFDPPTFDGPKRVREPRITIGFSDPEELEAAKAKAASREMPLAEMVRRLLRDA